MDNHGTVNKEEMTYSENGEASTLNGSSWLIPGQISANKFE